MIDMKLAERILLIFGIICFSMAFISEFFFHYYLEFMPDNPDIPIDIFWIAEYGEVLNSMTFLILGILLIMIAIWISRKRKSCIIKQTDFCKKYF